ncbi:hypothetical protein IWX47DRAFT_715129 [Phyllosticta citricarpa]
MVDSFCPLQLEAIQAGQLKSRLKLLLSTLDCRQVVGGRRCCVSNRVRHRHQTRGPALLAFGLRRLSSSVTHNDKSHRLPLHQSHHLMLAFPCTQFQSHPDTWVSPAWLQFHRYRRLHRSRWKQDRCVGTAPGWEQDWRSLRHVTKKGNRKLSSMRLEINHRLVDSILILSPCQCQHGIAVRELVPTGLALVTRWQTDIKRALGKTSDQQPAASLSIPCPKSCGKNRRWARVGGG